MIIQRVTFDVPPGNSDMLDGHHASDFVLKSGDTMGTLNTGYLEVVSADAADAMILSKVPPPAIKTSLDGGVKWASVVNNGDPVEGLNGVDMSNKSLLVRQEFGTNDVSQTPVLKSCDVNMVGASDVAVTEQYGNDFLSMLSVDTAFARTGTTYKDDGITAVASNTPRFETEGLTIEEGTANLLANSNFAADSNSDGLADGWVEYNAVTTTDIVTWADGRKAQQVVVPEGTVDTAGIYQAVTLAPNTVYTVSFDVSYIKTANFTSRWKPWCPNYGWIGDSYVELYTNPYRFSATFTTTAAGETQFHILNVGYADGGTYYPTISEGIEVTNVQIEAKPYSTSWTPSTRGDESLSVTAANVINATEGTIELVANLTEASLNNGGGTAYHQLFATQDGSDNNRIALCFVPTDSMLHYYLTDGSGNNTDISYPQSNILQGQHRFAVRWSKTEAAMVIDGVKVATAANPYLPTVVNQYIWLGTAGTGTSNWLDGQITNFVASDRWRSDIELENRGYPDPLYVDASTTCLLPLASDIRDSAGTQLINVEVPHITKTWDDNQVTNQTIFGVAGCTQYASDGKLHIRAMSGCDIRVRLDDMPATTDFVAQFDACCPSVSPCDGGFLYRTTYWGDEVNCYGYYVGADTDGKLLFAKSSNTSTTSWTWLSNTITCFTPGKWYTIKIIVNGTRHIIQVNGVTQIDMNDSTHMGPGQFGFRAGNAGQYMDFDNLSIYANGLQLAQQGTNVVNVKDSYADFTANQKAPAIFTRGAGNAYNNDGTLAKYIAWSDDFSTDKLSQYDGGGDNIGTWSVTGGTLQGSATSPAQSHLLKTGLILSDAEIEATMNSAQDAGLILRHVDNNNHYLLAIRDDSSSANTQNIAIFKRINGTYNQLTVNDITLPRGTDAKISFRAQGTTLTAYVNDSVIATTTDSTFSSGRVGLRNDNTPFIFKTLNIYDLSKSAPRFDTAGITIEEGTTNRQSANITNGRITTMTAGGTTPPTVTLVASDNPFASDGKAWEIVFPSTVSAGYAGCRATGGNWSCTASTTYTTTAWIKYTDIAGITLYHTGTAGMSSLTATGKVIGEWHEYSSTSAPGLTGTDYLTVYASSTAAANKTIYIGASMVEQKAYRTSYTDTSRGVEDLTIPTANILSITEGTIEFILNITPQMVEASMGSHQQLNVYPVSISADRISVFHNSDNKWYIRLRDHSGNTTDVSCSDSGLTSGAHRFAIRWSAQEAALFIDGVKKGTQATPYLPSILGPAIWIGHNGTHVNYMNGQMSDLMVSSEWRDDAALTARGTLSPLCADSITTLYMPLNGSLDDIMTSRFDNVTTSWFSGVTGQYAYYKTHVINGSTDGDLSQYQVKFDVYSGSGTDANGTVYLGGRSLCWPNDIRFTSASGVLLDYWIESYDNTHAVIWVEVDSIPTAGTTIYLWYGKANDQSMSDGTNTFPMLFDHFDGSGVNTNTWTVANTGSSTATTSASLLTINNNSSGTGSIYTKVSYNAGYALRGRVRMGVAQSYFQWCTGSDADEHWFETLDGTTLQYRSVIGGGNIVRAAVPGVTFSASTYYNFEIQRPVGYGVKYLVDDSLKVTYPYTSSGQTISARIASWGNTGVTYVDWCLLRKITINEPTHSASWSAETSNVSSQYTYRKLHQIVGSSTGTTDYQMLFDVYPGTGVDGTLPLNDFTAGQWWTGGSVGLNWNSATVNAGTSNEIHHLVTGLTAGQTYTIYVHTTAASGTPSFNVYSGTPGNTNATLVVGGTTAGNIALGDNTVTATVQAGHTSLMIYLWGHSTPSGTDGSMTVDKVTISNIPNVVYLNGHSLSFPNDIRFTTDDGLTQMDYWVEAYAKYAGGEPDHALIWVKVPSLPASTTTNMYVYYGRSDDVGMSNGDRTFQFFEDFNAIAGTVNNLGYNQSTGGEDSTTTGFDYYNSTMSRDTSVYYQGASSIKWTIATAGQAGSMRLNNTKINPSTPYTASCYSKCSNSTPSTVTMYIWYADCNGTILRHSGGSNTTVNNSTWTRCTTTSYPPPYAVYAMVEIYGTAIANGDSFYADNFQLEQGTTATTWVPGGVLGLGPTNLLTAGMADAETYTAGFPAAFSGYSYRKSHVVTSSEALTSFQVKLTLHRTGTSDSGADVYLNGHSSTWNGTAGTLADIRFGNNAGTSLDYWIEYDDGNTAYVWVEVDSLSTSGTTIWIYYGKTSDTNASSGANTFIFYDDFTTINNWTASYKVMENSGPFASLNTGYNAPSVSGNNLTLGGTRSGTDAAYEDGVNSGWWGRSVKKTASISDNNFTVGTRGYFTQSSSGGYANQYNVFEVGVGQDKDNYTYGKWSSGGVIAMGVEYGGTRSGGNNVSLSLSASTYYNCELKFVNGGWSFYTLNGTTTSFAPTTTFTNKYITLAFDHRAPNASVTMLWDWLYVRKYTATEPTHGAWGTEQPSSTINTTEVAAYYSNLTLNTTTAYHGTKSIGLLSTSSGSDCYAKMFNLSLSPSTWYAWQVRIYAPATVYYKPGYFFPQETGGSYRTPLNTTYWVDGTETASSTVVTFTTGWHLVSAVGLTHSDWQTGGTYTRLVFRPACNSGGTAYDTTNTLLFDCFQLERNNVVSPWVPGTMSGLDPTKWNTVDGTNMTIQDGVNQFGNTSAKVVSNATFGPGYTLEAKHWTYSIPPNGYTPIGFASSTTDGVSFLNHSTNKYYRNDAAWVSNTGEYPKQAYLLYRIDTGAYTTNLRVSYYNTDVSVWDIGGITNTVSATERIFFGIRQDEGILYLNQSFNAITDWIRVRKYLPTAPTHGAWGGEETTDTHGSLTLKQAGVNYSRSFSTSAELGTGLLSGNISLSTGYPKTSGGTTGTWMPAADNISQVGVADSSYIEWDCSSLAANSGFETGDLTSWSIFNAGFPDTSRYSITATNTTAYAGSYSAHFTCDMYSSGAYFGIVQENVNGARAGETHVVSIRVKGWAEGPISLIVDHRNSGGTLLRWDNIQLPTPFNYSDWTLLEFTTTAAPAGTTYFRPHIWVNGTCDFYVDDYRLYPTNQVTVYTSLDGGSSWAQCTNHAQMPNIQPGTNCTGKNLLIKAVMTSDAAQSYPPSLYSLKASVTSQRSQTGTWISPPMYISSAESAIASGVNWSSSIPATTALAVYTSTDDEATWSAVANGGAISTLTDIPVDCTNKAVHLKVSMTGDGSASPALSTITTTVRSAYEQSGYRIAPAVDLSPLGVAADSSVTWMATPPTSHISIGGPTKSDLYISENISADNAVDTPLNPTWSMQLRTDSDEFAIRRTGYWYDDFNDDSLSPSYTKKNSASNVWLERNGVLTANCWYATGDPAGLIVNNMSYFDEDMEIVAKLKVSRAPFTDRGCRAGVGLKADANGRGYKFLMTYYNGGTEIAFLHDAVAFYSETSYTITANTWYWMKFRVTGASGSRNLYGKIWLDGAAEPTSWTITYTGETNTTYQGTQPIMDVAINGNKDIKVTFDNLSVRKAGTATGDLIKVDDAGTLTVTGAGTSIVPGKVRTSTLLVAASDASQAVKNAADYVCDGDADDVEINAALAALPAGNYVHNKLTANQSNIETDTTGLYAGSAVTIARNTTYKWQGSASLAVTANGVGSDSFAYVGGDWGGMRLGVLPGHTYTMSGYIYVPAATGLSPDSTSRGLSICGFGYDATGAGFEVRSNVPTVTDQWVRLTCTITLPVDSRNAFFRLYNGFTANGKVVYYDGLQFEEGPTAHDWQLGGTVTQAGGGKVTLSEGTFNLSNYVNLGAGFVTIAGNSAGGTKLVMSPGYGTSVAAMSAENGASHITVENLTLDGNKANQTNATGALLQFGGVRNLNIRNIEGKNSKADAVYVASNSTDVSVQNVTGHDCDGCAVSVVSATDFVVSSCNAYNNGSTGGGFYATNCGAGIFMNCTSNNNTYSGIYLDNGCRNVIVTGCSCDSNGASGILCNGTLCSIVNNTASNNTTNGFASNVGQYLLIRSNSANGNHGSGIDTYGAASTSHGYNITGNACYNNTICGISINGLAETLIYGNSCYYNGADGILMFGTSNYNSIASNLCYENSKTTNNTYSNIRLSGASYNLIYGNKVYKGDSGNMPYAGINLQTSDCTGNVVLGNDCLNGGVSNAVNNTGTSTVLGTGVWTNLNRM